MTTDKQSDHFAKYKNPEVISGDGVLGSCRVIAQLKNNRWAIWECDAGWGGVLEKGLRLRDHSGNLVSFHDKQQAIDYSNRMK